MQKLECRPSHNAIGFSLFCFFLFVAILFSFPENNAAQIALLFSFGWPAIWSFCFWKRAGIFADETGLRWRGSFDSWKTARWDEISDFYFPRLQSKSSRTVETINGSLDFSAGNYSHANELAELVQQRAANIQTREWQHKGLREHDQWPRRFSYSSKESIGKLPFAWLATLFMASCALWMMRGIALSPYGAWDFISLPMKFFLTGFTMLFFTRAPAYATFALWKRQKEAKKRRHETIEVSWENLVWSDQARQIEASWNEIRHVRLLPKSGRFSRFQIETSQGNFEISTTIINWRTLSILISSRAPHLQTDSSL